MIVLSCFRGVVAVTMDLLQLDINQCPEKVSTPNAFKGTHKCDTESSYVSLTFQLLTYCNKSYLDRYPVKSMLSLWEPRDYRITARVANRKTHCRVGTLVAVPWTYGLWS